MNIPINIPDRKIDKWAISTFKVSEDDAKFFNLKLGNRTIRPGKYKKLTYENMSIMSNTPAEIRDLYKVIYQAKKGGNILINGLGLGVVLKAILKNENVTCVTVIEKHEEVISLVGPSFSHDKRVNIIHADAFEWQPPKGIRYNIVWHDIWNSICVDNLRGITRLHRKYGRKTDWQGSWCKEVCKKIRNQENHYLR